MVSGDPELLPSKAKPAQSAARGRAEGMRMAGQLGSLGLSVVLALAISVGIGVWLDRLTGWSPLFLIVFFVIGFAAGILNVYRTLARMK